LPLFGIYIIKFNVTKILLSEFSHRITFSLPFGIRFFSVNNTLNLQDNYNILNSVKEKKSKFTDIYFKMSELNNFKIFASKLEILQTGIRYSILFRLETSMLNYNYTGDDIITVQLLIYHVEYTENIIKSPESIFILQTLGLNKDLAETTVAKANLGYNKLLPLTMDVDDYDSKLVSLKPEVENGLISSVNINGNSTDFLNLVNTNNKDKITLDVDTKLFTDKDSKYVVALESKRIDGYTNNNINIFTNNGHNILNVTDKKIDNSNFSRTMGNITNVINNNKVITSTRIDVKLDLIKRPKPQFTLRNLKKNNPFIGTIDLETFKYNSISKVYAGGFYTKQFLLIKTIYIQIQL